jgi:hypothetical protein
MRVKRIHTNSKIFFSNPYVLRLDYSETPFTDALSDYTKTTRRAYRVITGTWGYTTLEFEMAQFKNDHGHVNPPGGAFFNGMNQGQVIQSLLNPDYKQMPRGYICFEDEMDALQFRLSVSSNAIHVQMWPSRMFTIHEVVETDEQ